MKEEVYKIHLSGVADCCELIENTFPFFQANITPFLAKR